MAVVEEEGVASEDSRGSSSVDDPWKRVGELPKGLAEKLLELKNERWDSYKQNYRLIVYPAVTQEADNMLVDGMNVANEPFHTFFNSVSM